MDCRYYFNSYCLFVYILKTNRFAVSTIANSFGTLATGAGDLTVRLVRKVNNNDVISKFQVILITSLKRSGE